MFDEFVRVEIGSDSENPIHLNPHDWHTVDQSQSVWNHRQVNRGMVGNGRWALNVTRAGTYSFELRRWPAHLEEPIEATHACIRIGNLEQERAVSPDDTYVTFGVDLSNGPSTLQTWLTLPDGQDRGAYFVYAERME